MGWGPRQMEKCETWTCNCVCMSPVRSCSCTCTHPPTPTPCMSPVGRYEVWEQVDVRRCGGRCISSGGVRAGVCISSGGVGAGGCVSSGEVWEQAGVSPVEVWEQAGVSPVGRCGSRQVRLQWGSVGAGGCVSRGRCGQVCNAVTTGQCLFRHASKHIHPPLLCDMLREEY